VIRDGEKAENETSLITDDADDADTTKAKFPQRIQQRESRKAEYAFAAAKPAVSAPLSAANAMVTGRSRHRLG
jgi:hypothetical protein